MGNTENNTEVKRETASEAAKREMNELKLRLPKDWRIRFFLKFKEYDTAGGGRLINSVYYNQTTDPEVLKRFKILAAEYEASPKENF